MPARLADLSPSLAVEACRLSFVLDVTEHRKQTFFPIDHVLGSENPSRASNALGTHAAGPRIDGVLHVGQLACRYRARQNARAALMPIADTI
jgi:hypothetical protein